MKHSNKPFAEVIESSLHTWTAQSWAWDQFPPYGSLCAIEQDRSQHIGLVYEVNTGSMDPTRYPFPFQKTEEELKKEQPQIFSFLRTSFSCLVLGSIEQGIIRYSTPSQPAKMHAFVSPLSQELAQRFFSSDAYLHRLFSLSSYIMNLDDLLIALLEQRTVYNALSTTSMKRFLQTYSLLTGNDYRRMKLFIQRAPKELGS